MTRVYVISLYNLENNRRPPLDTTTSIWYTSIMTNTYRIHLGTSGTAIIRVIRCKPEDLELELWIEANRGGAGPVTKVEKIS